MVSIIVDVNENLFWFTKPSILCLFIEDYEPRKFLKIFKFGFYLPALFSNILNLEMCLLHLSSIKKLLKW